MSACKRCGYDAERETEYLRYLANLKDMDGQVERLARAEEIIAEVALEWGVTVIAIKGPSRRRQHVSARDEAIRRIRGSDLDMYLKEIGHLLGGRHHTSIIHSLKKEPVEGAT